jgi:hypothetical protein
MSDATLILVRLDELTREVRGLRATIAARAVAPWPERMTTQEAVRYVREAYGRPRFNARSLRGWRADGRLTRFSPCRWDRAELDVVMAGVPVSAETRGRRRAS